jgi:tRNA1(Val) A37 N6-methylase TrmN6
MPAAAGATIEGDAKLPDWIDFCLDMVVGEGSITMIHRADRLDEILSILRVRAGGIVVFPLWPGAREGGVEPDAKRIIIQARKGSKAPLRLAAGLILHDRAGAYTAEAESVLRDAGPLVL